MHIRRIFVLPLCLIALAACSSNSDIKESLGLNRKGPDEFQVYARPPLSVPPDFNLRPPGEGAVGQVAGEPAEQKAHESILGAASPVTVPAGSVLSGPAPTAAPAVSSAPLPSTADSQFLANVGAARVDPRVRQELTDEKFNGTTAGSPYLIGGGKTGDSTVDASGEAVRLKQDKAQNQPPTTGDTPTVEPQSKGILGDLF